MSLAPALAPFGVMRLMLTFSDSEPAYLPAHLRKVEIALRSRSDYWERFIAEQKATTEIYSSVYAQKAPLGDKPVVVLTSGLLRTYAKVEAAQEENAAPGFMESVIQRWKVSRHRALASSSSRGRTVVAKKSGHYIQFDEPELVVGAIRDVVHAAR